MSLPEEILEHLLCSKCHKYLSVQPVKVYPDRSVKCGRCNRFFLQVDDGGVESPLYKSLVGNLTFPCVNRYEGCKELLKWSSNIWEHEAMCVNEIYNCRECARFQGSSYDLYHHIKEHHKDKILTSKQFVLELDEGSHINTYFYIESNLLVCVVCQFDSTTNELFLDLSTPLGKRTEPLKQQFFLYTIDNIIKCKSALKSCSNYDRIQGEGHLFYLSKEDFRKSVVLVKFEVKEDVVLHLDQNVRFTFDPQSNVATWRCTFDHVSKLNIGKKLSSKVFYLANLPWRIVILKIAGNNSKMVNVYLNLLRETVCTADVLTRVVPSDVNVLNFNKGQSRKLSVLFSKEGLIQYSRLIFTASDVTNTPYCQGQNDDSLTLEIDITVHVGNSDQEEADCSHIDKKFKGDESIESDESDESGESDDSSEK